MENMINTEYGSNSYIAAEQRRIKGREVKISSNSAKQALDLEIKGIKEKLAEL